MLLMPGEEGEEELPEEDPFVDVENDNDSDGYSPSLAPDDGPSAGPASVKIEADVEQGSGLAEPGIVEITDSDSDVDEPLRPVPAPGPEVSQPKKPAMPARSFAGRRAYEHPKSFEFGIFYIKYRADNSLLYPDRVNAWTTTCPYHGISCAKSIQINQPDEETALRRLLTWCLKATSFTSKKAS